MTPLFAIDRDTGLDLESGLESEWLETNGLGGYASSTVLLCPTRRYHGLLVARPEGNEKRHVLLSRFEETVVGRRDLTLSTARFADAWGARGDACLASFELDPHPRWVHRGGELELTREVQMVRGADVVLCRYRARGAEADLELDLRPFLPYREADALTIENDVLDPRAVATANGFHAAPYDALPAVHVTVSGSASFTSDPLWYGRVELSADRARGYPSREDHFSPGVLRLELPRDTHVVVAVALGAPVEDPESAWKKEARRRSTLLRKLRKAAPTEPTLRLALSAEDFLTRTEGRLGVCAGYPWFGEWGRDTFIALPGLTLARGQVAACEEVLSQSLEYLRDGLIPNVFGLSRESSHYGSVDASLWYARAVQLYGHAVDGGGQLLDEYLPALVEIATSYWEGTGLGIQADEGGLIRAGSADLNATWMDARTPAGPVTPRAGCAVEINALWYSLLRQVELYFDEIGDRPARKLWGERRRRAKRTFLERFWSDERGYLADVWTEDGVDERVRPNMVLAAALEHSPLKKAQRARVVDRAEADLVTPQGLRTLAPEEDGYVGRYQGGPEERDGAYHQGTVWPWLFGSYVEAALRGRGTKRAVRRELEARWDALVPELDRAGLDHVSEVFDGDEPRRPGGTIAQAWNTAELLRSHAMLERGRP
jgi:predicted glycogen debranching enzyme